MIRKILIFTILFSISSLKDLSAQYSGKDFSFSLNGNYTTTAKVYLNPNSSDIDVKNRFMPLEDIFSPSVDIRLRISETLLLGLNTELIEKTGTNSITVLSDQGTISIPVEDGFKVIPFEFSVHYIVPFSTEKFKFLLGGGVAYYYGNHIRKFGNEEVANLKRNFAYGIQVCVSSDYMINEFLSLRGEMKFRDPEFEVTSKYNNQRIEYNGGIIRVSDVPFDTKINIDGVTFTVGIALHF